MVTKFQRKKTRINKIKKDQEQGKTTEVKEEADDE